jgi:uncharacterized membrane protein YqiK
MGHMHFQISDDIDREIRIFVAEGGGKKGDLSMFAEDALTAHLRKLTKARIAAELKLDASQMSDNN